jgi:hypothetical protein
VSLVNGRLLEADWARMVRYIWLRNERYSFGKRNTYRTEIRECGLFEVLPLATLGKVRGRCTARRKRVI